MDLDEWEYLSDDGNGNGKRLISRDKSFLYENSMIDMDYFQKFIDPPKKVKIDPIGGSPNPVIPVPVEFDCPILESPKHDLVVKEVISPENSPVPEGDRDTVSSQAFIKETRDGEFANMKLDSPNSTDTQIEISPVPEGDQENLSSQPFFKKVTEDEFADMKLDSPKSTDTQIEISLAPEGDQENLSSRAFFNIVTEDEFSDMKSDSPKSIDTQIKLGRPQFELKAEGFEGVGDEIILEVANKSDDKAKGVFGCKENLEVLDEELESDKNGGGLNIWKMGMTGVGALCSFGFAFATICVIALGSRHRERYQDQNLHFQIYTHEKRFKQVMHHAAKLNGSISVVRGDPLSRAHISIGGYFEGL